MRAPTRASPEPDPARLGGPGVGARLRRAWLATRPQFLTASALPVLLGTAWGAQRAGSLDPWSFWLALAGVVLLHAAGNVWNDVGDEQCGTDRINDGRMYPFTGGSRLIQNGVMTVGEMTGLSILLTLLALVVGLLLAWRHGWPVIALGAVGAGLGGLYSWPRVQLAGRGLGEIAVGLAFGLLPVSGAAWLQQTTVDAGSLLLSLPVALWVTAILLFNELPDRAADARTGKRTLPVRLGVRGTGWLYVGLQATAFGGLLAWQQHADLPAWPLVFFLGLAGAGVRLGWQTACGRAALAPGIRLTLAIHAGGCLMLIGWVLISVAPGS